MNMKTTMLNELINANSIIMVYTWYSVVKVARKGSQTCIILKPWTFVAQIPIFDFQYHVL